MNETAKTQTIEVEVEMLAFMDGAIRTVEIPEEEWSAVVYATRHDETATAVLELVFRYGQNDVQPKQCCSVSVGDVIQIGIERFRVEAFGFQQLCKAEKEEN